MSGIEMTETTRNALIMWAAVVRSAVAAMSLAPTYGNGMEGQCVKEEGAFCGDHRNTHRELHVHEDGGGNRQHIQWVRNREIGQKRHAAPVELLEGEDTEPLDAKEHAKRDGQLYEGHQQHGKHAHARFLVHAALLERDALHAELVARLVRPVELSLELEQPRLLRRERGRVTQLFDREGQQQQPREQRAYDDCVEPRQTRRDVHKLEQPRGEPRGRPPGEPECREVAVLEGRERRERVERLRLGQRGDLRQGVIGRRWRRWRGSDRRGNDRFGNEGLWRRRGCRRWWYLGFLREEPYATCCERHPHP
jgi:hypothetical protein